MTPSASEYAELGLIMTEILLSKEIIQLWSENLASGRHEVAAVFFRDTALVIAEIFRDGLDAQAVFGDDQDAHDYLKWFRDIRRTYSPHRFGSGRECIAAVHLEIDGERAKPLGISYFAYAAAFDIPSFKDAVEEFLDPIVLYLEPKLEALNQKVLAEVCAMSSVQLLALPHALPKELTLDDFGRTRNEVRKGLPAGSRQKR